MTLMLKHKIVLAVIFSFSFSLAQAYEVKKVCAKYETNYSWSKPYAVTANIYSGTELNKEVGSFTKYSSINHYAVIFWSNEQASIIKLSPPYISGMMMINKNGNDQNGRSWQLADNNYGCF